MDGKICQNINPPTPTHIPSSVQFSTWGRLEDEAKNSYYTFCYMLIVLEIFLSKTKFNCFKKRSTFFVLFASKNMKIQKIKFEVGFSYKDCI